jgi:hypothetical protein
MLFGFLKQLWSPKVDFVIAIQCSITRDVAYAALHGSLIFGCIFWGTSDFSI